MLCLIVSAQYYTSASGNTRHYVSLSIAGGEANTLSYNDLIEDYAGGAAQFTVAYELLHRNFFFNVGLSADYTHTGQSLLDFTDSFERLDFEYDALTYSYVYSNYQEVQNTFAVSIPLQFGYNFGQYFYGAIGAKFVIPVENKYHTMTEMFTQGEYERFFEPFRNKPEYGFYEKDVYTDSGRSNAFSCLQAAATLELGSNIPLRAKKVRMRAGVYAEYAIPVGDMTRLPLTDYTAVDVNPFTQTQENLKSNLHLNSILTSTIQPDWHHNLQVGVRLTVAFDVTKAPFNCRCEIDW